MNLLISLHATFYDEESLGQEEEVEATGLEEDLDVAGSRSPPTVEDRTPRRRRMRWGRRDTRRVRGCTMRGLG
jgi:hypothetical protein